MQFQTFGTNGLRRIPQAKVTRGGRGKTAAGFAACRPLFLAKERGVRQDSKDGSLHLATIRLPLKFSKMINTKFLPDLGFNDNGMKRLPDWYNLFESEPLITEVPTYIFHIYRLTIYLFLTPKGQFVEVFCHDDPHRDSVYFHQYVAIHNHSNLVSVVNELLNIVSETNRKVDEDNTAFKEYRKTVEIRKRKGRNSR